MFGSHELTIMTDQSTLVAILRFLYYLHRASNGKYIIT